MDRRQRLQEKQAEIQQIATKHRATNPRIFGAAIGGNAIPDRGAIDFLADLTPSSSLLDRIALNQNLEDCLGYKINLSTEANLRPHFQEAIRAEAIPLEAALTSSCKQ